MEQDRKIWDPEPDEARDRAAAKTAVETPQQVRDEAVAKAKVEDGAKVVVEAKAEVKDRAVVEAEVAVLDVDETGETPSLPIQRRTRIMPRGDGTGPAGLGPMTGRAAGYCAGYQTPGFMTPVPGRGFWGWGRGGGWGRRGGRGWRHWFYATGLTDWQRAAMGWPGLGGFPAPYVAPPAPAAATEQVLEMLKGQASYLEDALEGIRKQIQDLQTNAEK